VGQTASTLLINHVSVTVRLRYRASACLVCSLKITFNFLLSLKKARDSTAGLSNSKVPYEECACLDLLGEVTP